MGFKPSYNIMDRDTHNALVNAFKTGGIAYTDDDGTVHKIADDYINSGGGGGSSLPEVTSADEGKVLAVNASGEWAAELRAVYFYQNDHVLDMTYADIKAAFDSRISLYMVYEDEDLCELMGPVTAVGYMNDIYTVQILMFNSGTVVHYVTNTTDGYPVLVD